VKKEYELELGGRGFKITTGEWAKLANSSVVVQYGESVVLVSACRSEEPLEDVDFTPLMVEYREKTYAAGKIPGGFFKREGRPSEKEILTARMIDRPIRPLLPEGYTYDTQITAFALSFDNENDTDILAVNGASFAMTISDIPFDGPVGAVRIGYIDGEYVVNPTLTQVENSDLDLVVVSTKDRVVMLEGGAYQIDEETVIGAIQRGMDENGRIVDLQLRMREEIGKDKIAYTPITFDSELMDRISSVYEDKAYKLIQMGDKEERREARKELIEEVLESEGVGEEDEEKKKELARIIEGLEKNAFRRIVLSENRRPDGRDFDEIRPVECMVGILPRTHGSALFARGQTQALVVTTLGTVEDEQLIDALGGDTYKKFMLHYNFPPFSVGEVKPIRGVSRREIGHGALAEKALRRLIPNENDFPYTIRIVSDILESNGSSSMATVCGASMSMMDAGIPMKAAVAGIAVGLVSDEKTYRLLMDIEGMEDHYGEMDLKVAGTRKGITAVQMDLKIAGIPIDILKEGFEMAKRARGRVLDIMDSVISKPRGEISPYAPKIRILQIPVEKIGEVIGPGGKIIRKILEETGAEIDIKDDGRVFIATSDPKMLQRAVDMIEELTAEVEPGKIYKGKVVKVTDYGAFIEILPGKEGLCHISQLANERVEKVRDVVKEGDEVVVKLTEIDDLGRLNLSRKAALMEMGVGGGRGRDKKDGRSGPGHQKGKNDSRH